MGHPTYAWQEPYTAAILETDDAKMPSHILEATAAIEQRLLSPVESSEEQQAIRNAQEGIATLRAERCASKSNGNGNGHFPTMP